MTATTETVEFDGAFLQRGFWLYVWEVSPRDRDIVLYVGRTGDSSSANAQSPFNRMGQHLGAKNSSMLRKHLADRQIDAQSSRYRMIAHGPVLPEAADKDMDEHRTLRDQVAAVEQRLQQDLSAAGYTVLNVVRSKTALDPKLYTPVRAAFAEHFPRLAA